MEDEKVLLEQRPERLRRHPVIFFFLFWLLPLSIPAWGLAFIESKAEKIKITEERIIYRRGIIRKDKIELPRDQIRQVIVKQGWLDRMLNMGTLNLTTAGDMSELTISGFHDPEKIKKLCRK